MIKEHCTLKCPYAKQDEPDDTPLCEYPRSIEDLENEMKRNIVPNNCPWLNGGR